MTSNSTEREQELLIRQLVLPFSPVCLVHRRQVKMVEADPRVLMHLVRARQEIITTIIVLVPRLQVILSNLLSRLIPLLLIAKPIRQQDPGRRHRPSVV